MDLLEIEYEVVLLDSSTVPSHIYIPHPDGTNAPIQTHNMPEVANMLGLYFSPNGSLVDHIKKIQNKSFYWQDSLTAKPLPTRDTWLSFYMQSIQG